MKRRRVRIPWNKGRKTGPLSKEHRSKISQALAGVKKSPDHAHHIGDAKRGIPRTLECVEKVRASSVGKRYSPATEFKKGLKPWNMGTVGFGAGAKNGHWKGGIVGASGGYIQATRKDHPLARNGYVLEHRLVVESLIGRHLTEKEEVHHLNRIKDDNIPSNLMAFSAKKWHVKFEFGKFVPEDEIIFDGREL